ncbi:hypothetical protein Lal_00034302 [Lupinus albus]|nr:hypothetical protein Lal_00034302 [Lupinus albus]
MWFLRLVLVLKLLEAGKKVIAVEIDPRMVLELQRRFQGTPYSNRFTALSTEENSLITDTKLDLSNIGDCMDDESMEMKGGTDDEVEDGKAGKVQSEFKSKIVGMCKPLARFFKQSLLGFARKNHKSNVSGNRKLL